MVNESDGGPRHSIDAPQDVNQVSNFQKEISRQFSISHDALFNVYQLCLQLFTTTPKGERLILSLFVTHPNVLIHMLYQPLLDVIEKVLRLFHDTFCLHYDTVFNIGDFYLSTVTFRHMLFKKNPVMPFAFFIHSRKIYDNHVDFLRLAVLNDKEIEEYWMILVFHLLLDFEYILPKLLLSRKSTITWFFNLPILIVTILHLFPFLPVPIMIEISN